MLKDHQDAFGHVNHTVPLRWFESARIAYLEQSGLGHMMSGHERGPIVASVTCHYRRQLRYPDKVKIGVRVASMRRSSMIMEQVVFSPHHGAIAVEGTAVIVIYDYQKQRPARIPEDMKTAIERYEKRPIVVEPNPVDGRERPVAVHCLQCEVNQVAEGRIPGR